MHRARGFTLIELMIASVIALVAVGGALAMLRTQNAVFHREVSLSSAVTQGELALDGVQRATSLAGTGIDPQMAFDFDHYNCALPGAAAPSNCTTPTTCMQESANCAARNRDSNTGADELVLAYRDPAFATSAPPTAATGCTKSTTFVGKVWAVTAATASGVTLVLKPGDELYRGQVLQLVCDDGATYAYATISSPHMTVASTATACSVTPVALYATVVGDPYNQASALAASCFSTGNARAYAVRRQRFFVYRDLSPSTLVPYLMLDQGLDLNDNGALDDGDLQPIASDIEDFQVAYATEQPGILSLNPAPTGWTTAAFVVDSNQNGVWGDDPGAAGPEELSDDQTNNAVTKAQLAAANVALGGKSYACTAYSTLAAYNYPCLFGTTPVDNVVGSTIHAYRWMAWPGNVSLVGVGFVVREHVRDAAPLADAASIPPMFNRAGLAANSVAASAAWYAALRPAGHKRFVVTTGIRPSNIALSSPYWN